MNNDPTPLLQESEKKILELLNTDMDLSFTFLRIAEGAESDSEKRERNIENARKAYETTAKWLERIKPEDPEGQEIRAKLGQLGEWLEKLGAKL